jgi:outer membrane protein with beta-barrel domain
VSAIFTDELGESKMRFRALWIGAGLILLFGAAPAKAQYGRDKWEIAPFVGYETSGSFPLNPQTVGVNVNDLRVDGATSFGTFIDYSLTRNAQAEFMWDRNLTSYSAQRFPDDPFFKAYDSTIDQYQFGLLYMFLGSDHRFRPYAAGSLGFTHEFNSGGNPARTDFAYSLGGGVKYELSRHLALRGDARYMPTYANSSLALFCDPFFGCYTAKVSNYQHRGNFVAGIVFKF